MWYLFLQIWVWVAAAFIFGWLSHWFLCCRNKAEEDSKPDISSSATVESVPAVVANNTVAIDESWKPQGFASAPEHVDDLKRIKGVGSVIEETLHDLGIYQFAQISSWNDDNVVWVENFLAFPGRIAREEWAEQAKTLSAGGTTEFANRVDKGDIDYS